MGVSERDRAVMRRIGGAKEAAHAEARTAHLAHPVEERLRRSWALYLRSATIVAPSSDDPSPFYERARARKLCPP